MEHLPWPLQPPSTPATTGVPFQTAYRTAESYLLESKVPDADISARYLLCDVAKTGYRLSDFNRAMMVGSMVSLDAQQYRQLGDFCAQRAARVPVQYIIGNWDFFGLTLECKAPVLIPRPETEELVERILSSNILSSTLPIRILDVGAGTGAIGLALLSKLPKATCVAVDINPLAVALANRNAESILGANYNSRYECLLTSFGDYAAAAAIGNDDKDKFDLIVSNPPYIPSEDVHALEPEVVRYEDRVALDGGLDGLDIVKELIDLGPTLLRSSGSQEMWLEVSREHPTVIEQWFVQQQREQQGKFGFVQGIVDLAGNPRFVRLKKL